MRVQNPGISKTTEDETSRWYIRPYVDQLDPQSGELVSKQQRIYLGDCRTMSKREAMARRTEVMARINKTQFAVQSQLKFGDFLETYLREFVRRPDNLASSTQEHYESHIKLHIRPAFESLNMADINTQMIDTWLAAKAKAGLSWSTRMGMRNVLSGIFTQAERWGAWEGKNPTKWANVGRKRMAREPRKMSEDEILKLLAELPDDVRLICRVALFTTLRISEILGLQWRHIDFAAQPPRIRVRQRYYHGDIDIVKSEKGNRDVQLGHLAEELAMLHPGAGHEDDFVFTVRTYLGHDKAPRITRDASDINQHFLRPAAKKLGIYYLGFGFHVFRREAITAMGDRLSTFQVQKMAGHSRPAMSSHYTLVDREQQDSAVKQFQEHLEGNGSENALAWCQRKRKELEGKRLVN